MAIGPLGPQLPLPPIYKPPTPRVAPPVGDSSSDDMPPVGVDRPGVGSIGSQPQAPTTGVQPLEGPGQAANSFAKLLGDAVGQIDKLQKTADGNIQKLATGQPVDLHDVTISVEQANLGFQLGLQVRNKLIEAYQEVMRMQV